MKDGLQGKQPTPADQQQMQAYARSMQASMVARNQTAAKEFLARNAQEKGVVTTASGLQYKILAPGDKKAPAIEPTDKVTVEYRGKLIDGTEFDSSYSRGVPATFPVNGVIKGWQEALVLMKPGAKWQLFVPPALAYGANPRPKIPGGSLLIFEVNVLSVQAAAPPARLAPPSTAPGSARPNTVPPNVPPGSPRQNPATLKGRRLAAGRARGQIAHRRRAVRAQAPASRRVIPGNTGRSKRRVIKRRIDSVSYCV